MIKYLGIGFSYIIFYFLIACACMMIFMNENFGVSMFYAFGYGLGIGVPLAISLVIVLLLARKWYYFIMPAGFALIILINLYFFIPPSRSEFFRHALINPIPNSVKDMKIDRMFAALDHIFVFSFTVSEGDVNSILTQKKFIPLEFMSYDDGILYWGGVISPEGSTRLHIYTHKQPPVWFDLQTWAAPQMYGVEIRSGYEQYLIYDKSRGRVILIDYKWK